MGERSGMELEVGSGRDDAPSVSALPFWVAAVGGLLLAIASIASLPGLVSGAATVLFVVGVVLFLFVALRRSREEGVPLTKALGQGARDAIRFAWWMMP